MNDIKIMEEYSFATVISHYKGETIATQLPLMMDEQRKYLYGHFTYSNPQSKEITTDQVLVTFQGPHC